MRMTVQVKGSIPSLFDNKFVQTDLEPEVWLKCQPQALHWVRISEMAYLETSAEAHPSE